jgi:hypothetical protein
MRNRIVGAPVVGAATVGLLMAGATATNAANISCLEESLNDAVADPAGALGAVLGDPVGSAKADAECARH